jgi:cytochrome P450
VLLLNAGHEATVNVVGNGVLALGRHPDQWQRLLGDPRLLEPAVEELIRYDSPLQLFERTALSETEIGGVRIQAGQKIGALLGSANRDPDVFADPTSFDVGRLVNPHLGFGGGIHFCVGAPLARLELQTSLETLLRRFPGLALAAEPPPRTEFVIRGLRELVVTLGGHVC